METTALNYIETSLSIAERPIILCSFGKDSIVLLHLVHRVDKHVPVIFWREPFIQKKNEFAYKMIQDMDLEVYDYPPSGVDFCYNNGEMGVISRRDVGGDLGLFSFKGLIEANSGLCMFKDFILRPLIPSYNYAWDLTFVGTKTSDTDPLFGDLKLSDILKPMGKTILFFPLKDWTDKDIWGYIHKHNVPYNVKRYDEKNSDYNNDYYECCYACVNPDNEDNVFCHRENRMIKNYGKQIDYQTKLKTIRNITGV